MKATIVGTDGSAVGVVNLDQKQFKTGSKGFFGQTKLVANGKTYQTQMQMVEVHSKPTAK